MRLCLPKEAPVLQAAVVDRADRHVDESHMSGCRGEGKGPIGGDGRFNVEQFGTPLWSTSTSKWTDCQDSLAGPGAMFVAQGAL